MSMYDDSELSGRFAAVAPEPLSGNWDEVLDRAGMARNGRQRLERSRAVPGRRRRLVVVLAAVALATAVTTAGWAIVREVVLHKSFVGLPPVGATPSAPESGELVIQYRLDTELARWQGRGWVYADGRLITLRLRLSRLRNQRSDLPEAANRWSSGFLEQRLTPEGVELLRSEIVSTGLFEHHQPAGRDVLPPQRDPGADRRPVGSRPARTFLSGCVSGSRIRRRGCRQARGRTVRSGRTWPPGTTIWYGAQPQTLERSRILSLLPAAAEDLLRDKDAVPEQGDIGYAGLPASFRSPATTPS